MNSQTSSNNTPLRCPDCGHEHDLEFSNELRSILSFFALEGDAKHPSLFCDICQHKKELAHKEQFYKDSKAEIEVKANKLVPAFYRENAANIPAGMRMWLDYAFPASIGLALEGVAGTFKSTLAFEIIRRRIIDRTFRNASILRGPDFSDIVLAQFTARSDAKKDEATNTLNNAKYASILYFDDIDKMRPTPTAISALLGILEFRYSNHKPFIFSTQANRETLLAMLVKASPPDDTSPSAIMRRLVERTKLVITKRP